MKFPVIYLVSVFLLIAFQPAKLEAQTRQKYYNVKVYTLDKKVVRGVLNSVDDTGVYLMKRKNNVPEQISPVSIKLIKLTRKSKSSTGSLIGFLSGAAISTGTILSLDMKDKYDVIRIAGGVLFTFTTTAIGGAISSRPDEVIHINGRTEDYLQNLNRLKTFTPKPQ